MATLSADQISFLRSQGISPAQVFDASKSASKAVRDVEMEALDLYFYFGGSPCQKGGHSLRTKAGHCIQCDHAKIAYQLRSSAAGYVYLAYSKKNSLVKVGFTKNMPQERVVFLIKENYANSNDWSLKRSIKYDKDAGKKEFEIHSYLEKYLFPISYEKNKGQLIICREVFSCTLDIALNAFSKVTGK